MSRRAHQNTAAETEVPHGHLCPITGDEMADPVIAIDGHSYERAAIEKWFLRSDLSPATGLRLPSTELIPNVNLRQAIQNAKEKRLAASTIAAGYDELLEDQVKHAEQLEKTLAETNAKLIKAEKEKIRMQQR